MPSSPDDWITDDEVPWPYAWPPILHNKNLPAPNAVYGEPDEGRHARIALPILSSPLDNSVGESLDDIEIELAKSVWKRREYFEDPEQIVTIHQWQNHH